MKTQIKKQKCDPDLLALRAVNLVRGLHGGSASKMEVAIAWFDRGGDYKGNKKFLAYCLRLLKKQSYEE